MAAVRWGRKENDQPGHKTLSHLTTITIHARTVARQTPVPAMAKKRKNLKPQTAAQATVKGHSPRLVK